LLISPINFESLYYQKQQNKQQEGESNTH